MTNTQEKIKNQILELLDLGDKSLQVFKHNNGLRLTLFGYRQLKRKVKCYEFDQPSYFKTRHLIEITRQFNYPYYIGTKKIVLFSDEDAVLVHLYGDIKTFLERFD